VQIARRFKNASVNLGFGLLALLVVVSTSAKPIKSQNHRPEIQQVETEAINAYADQGKMFRLAEYIKAQYGVSARKAVAIVTEAFRHGMEFDLDPELILAIIAVESTFTETAVGPGGARGLMQVLANSHPQKIKEIGGAYALFDPQKNIRTGAKILDSCLEESSGNVKRALLRYNGNKNPRAPYADKVLRVYSALKRVSNQE